MKKNKRKILIIILICVSAVITLAGFLYYNNQYYAKRLIKAIEKDDIAAVEKLMKSPFGNVNSYPGSKLLARFVEEHLDTPLQAACSKGNYEIIKLLLDKGANPNNVWNRETSPLQYAACSDKEDRFAIIKLLVEKGADVNYKYGYIIGNVILSNDRGYDTIEIIEYLEEHGAKIDGKLLVSACRAWNSEVIKYLLEERNVDINYQDSSDETPLISFVYPYFSDREKKLKIWNFCLLRARIKL